MSFAFLVPVIDKKSGDFKLKRFRDPEAARRYAKAHKIPASKIKCSNVRG